MKKTRAAFDRCATTLSPLFFFSNPPTTTTRKQADKKIGWCFRIPNQPKKKNSEFPVLQAVRRDDPAAGRGRKGATPAPPPPPPVRYVPGPAPPSSFPGARSAGGSPPPRPAALRAGEPPSGPVSLPSLLAWGVGGSPRSRRPPAGSAARGCARRLVGFAGRGPVSALAEGAGDLEAGVLLGFRVSAPVCLQY